ncbi:MAG: amidohydrolase family protein [Candidatus Thorarchaeota archaeon]|jgi:predicted TIM-barrel fold metal-dependent hydrolase
MLVVRALQDIPERGITKGDEYRLYIVDAHHHMGKEKSHRNTPTGAYEFYALLWFEMRRMTEKMMNEDSLLFEPVGVLAPELPDRIFTTRERWSQINHGWLVDRTIVFPYTDDYSKSRSPDEPSFYISNNKIAAWTTRAPHSSRLIGFARVDPKDALNGSPDRPILELERAIGELGLRGLKLHPLAQLFLDDIESDYTKNVMAKAGELGIPVILDTRNIRTAEKIRDLVVSMRQDEKYEKSMRGLSIILAHCAMSPGSTKLYDVLRDPAIYGETSTLHDKDVPVLFKMSSDRLKTPMESWSENLLFGTDYTFLSVQAAELILYLLSRDFPGNLEDVQRILAGNALSLVNRPFSTTGAAERTPQAVVCLGCEADAVITLEETIMKLISGEGWDITSVDYMIPPKHTWPKMQAVSAGGHNGIHFDSYIISLGVRGGTTEVHLWVKKGPGSITSCTVLGTKGEDALDSLEFGTQKINSTFTKAINENPIKSRTALDLTREVLKLLT